jgi:hypothetical protein
VCFCYLLFLTSYLVVIRCVVLLGLTGSVSTQWGTLLLSTFSPYSTSLYHVASVFVDECRVLVAMVGWCISLGVSGKSEYSSYTLSCVHLVVSRRYPLVPSPTSGTVTQVL